MSPFPTSLRHRRAQVVITTYCEFADGNLRQDEALIDVLTDLRHWSDGMGIDFTQALDHSSFHFDAEVEP